MYNVELQKQELDELNEDARNGLYDYILENSYLIKGKIQECIALEKENSINFENIRKLEQLLGKYDTEKENDEEIIDDSEENITNDFDDIARISKELEDLKETTTKLFEKRKQNIEFVNIWKRNIAVYIIAECREIEKEFENYEDTNNLNGENIVDLEQNSNIRDSENIENVTENDYLGNSSTENDYSENNNSENSNLENNNLDYNDFDNSNSANTLKEESKEKSSLTYRVKNESKENIDAIKKLLSDIERLISKQQNHAKIAGNIGISYSALNNGFEMRKNAEVVLELLNTIDSKINELCEKPKNKKNKEQLEKISKTNIEISLRQSRRRLWF